jgi:subtilase family serine protease
MAARAAAGSAGDCLTVTSPACYSPAQVRVAYGIQPLTERGITGRGETVVLPEIADSPGETPSDIRQDLARYDSKFGLPAVNLQVDAALAPGSHPFEASGEYAGDVEIVHAVAPQAAIRVILIPGNNNNVPAGVKDYATALRMAAALGGIVGLTNSVRESCLDSEETAMLHSALQFDQAHHVTVAESSGDFGAAGNPCTTTPAPGRGVDFPASDPLALSVGGTSLDANHRTGAYIGETVWNRPDPAEGFISGSGGGFSSEFARPDYQDGVPGIGARRGVPDVSADADQDAGIVFGEVFDGTFFIAPAGGTSASAPFWAGIVALADQYAGRHLGFVNPAIYRVGRSAHYHRAFHDVTKGNNTVKSGPFTIKGFNATRGWDPVTGWGSPDAQVLIPLLARYAAR